MQYENKNNIKTSDLCLGATLSLFSPILYIDFEDSGKGIFIFERSKENDSLIERYWNGSLLVKPIEFFQQLKVLKSRIYAGR